MSQSEIGTRTGLPEYLRKLVELYPRESWQSHNNFNSLTHFWLSRHIMFRGLIDRLQVDTQKLIEADPENQKLSTLPKMTDFFFHQLHDHHSIEDKHYFPMLINYDDDLRGGFDILDADHHALDRCSLDLYHKTKRLIGEQQLNNDIRPAADAVLDVQYEFKKILDRHLIDEEELIVPIILKYGGPEFG